MDKLQITKKGTDYTTFSIRIKKEIDDKLKEISDETGRTRNELINIILEFGLDNCETK